ncbi:hypothetical protein SLEP1_g3518 [Rubroshorea leprosula]|uniref:Methyltransferase n=1 Tax=Rubroshorea leprosula TaxID=152421 RepID=A0AAV5HTX8_9ROSI|nr:hypothetical protein SLEP1_g3518 [Rubroshorea leprosula]
MAGFNFLNPYHSIGKPSKPLTATTTFSFKKTYSLAFVLFLCLLSYLFGVWQHDGWSTGLALSTTTSTTTCKTITEGLSSSKPLDYESHHTASSDKAAPHEVVETYPLCHVKYGEYTPCEDPKRSLKFKRDRLIYRERHCPKKEELLKCRIPAPYGYKNPFSWPRSRDLAWFANVPHKELTVEKAVQNWIRYEGDKFRFPGGGTMFPNGADAYIDDIGELINLRDGSIRTALDTGCGVRILLHLHLLTSN